MIDALLNAIDRIIALIQKRIDSDRNFVTEQVDPIFNEMQVIHKDYISSFAGFIDKLKDSADRQKFISTVLKKQMEFEHIRVKVWSFSQVANHTDNIPEPARLFFESCVHYLDDRSHVIRDKSRLSGYSSLLLELADVECSSDFSMSQDYLIKKLSIRLDQTRKNWELVTRLYGQCRLELLR